MNSEYKTQIREILKILCVVIFASLYAFGGVEFKILRRFIAPIWLSVSIFAFSGDWKAFIQAPLLMITLSLGYGAENFFVKLVKRGLFGLANGITSIVYRQWKLFIVHIILCILLSVAFGVINPFGSARAEELAIGFIIGWLPIYMVKDRE